MNALIICCAFAAPLPPGSEDPALRKQVTQYLAVKPWAKVWAVAQRWKKEPLEFRSRLVGVLVTHVARNNHVGLDEPEDLIIVYRLDTGHLKFQGHGGSIDHDVFTDGGRAAWALSEIMNVELPQINEGLSARVRESRVREIVERVKRFQEDAAKAARSAAKK